ncbi:MAG: DUF2062 domain-containing protein [Nanoarchaeota archaeon]
MAQKKGIWKKTKQFLKTFAQTNTTPHEIALGFSIGIFIGIFPTPGISLILALFVIWLFKVNRLAVLLGLPIANPLTSPVFFIAGTKLGSWILGTGINVMELKFSWQTFLSVLREYLIGVTLIALFFSVLSYFLVYAIVKQHKEKKRKK